MTGPVTDPSPGGPGRSSEELFGEYAGQLAATGCEVIDPLRAWAEQLAAAAPPLTDGQRDMLARIFGGAQ
jgi:hypothetical protein